MNFQSEIGGLTTIRKWWWTFTLILRFNSLLKDIFEDVCDSRSLWSWSLEGWLNVCTDILKCLRLDMLISRMLSQISTLSVIT